MAPAFDGTEMLRLLIERAPAGAHLVLPPPCLTDMEGEPVEYEDGQRLVMRFPVLPRYRNPLGFMQGGFIAAALDNTLGPFSYLIAPPSVTSHMSLDYLRPVTAQDDHILCIASVRQRTRKTLYLAGEALGADGKVRAIAQVVCQVLPPA